MAHIGASSHGFGKHPLSVAEVTAEAGNFEYDPDVPLRYWIRTADVLLKQVYMPF
jgi:STAM-binding protein